MRAVSLFAMICLVGSSVSGGGAQAANPAAVHRSIGHAPELPQAATPPAPDAGCLDPSRLMVHAAFLPTAVGMAARCGHLLSTDTLLSVHHWGPHLTPQN